MEKLYYTLWRARGEAKDAIRDRLLEGVAPALIERGALRLSMCIDDSASDVRPPSPNLSGRPRMAAGVSVWVDDVDARAPLEELIRGAAHDSAGYLVTESLYTDYGGNRHAKPRDWPDGERSPGVVAVTAFPKPAKIPDEEWYRRWYERQSPVSEEMQPRTRYVRNAVVAPLTEGAPPYRGIVDECWPSKRHVENQLLFFGATNPVGLAVNMTNMMRSVLSFLQLPKIETNTMSEYLLKTDWS